MFLNRPAYRDTGKTRRGRVIYQLIDPLEFHSGLDGDSGLCVTVPAGFLTDLASTPAITWPIFPPAGPWSPAAILHDYLYGQQRCSRFLADALFREAMAQLEVPWWRRIVIYYAVRLFGRSHKTT